MDVFVFRFWNDHRLWTTATKDSFADLAQTSQDALINSFFWTWKISHSTLQDNPPNPMWSYQLGLAAGYIRYENDHLKILLHTSNYSSSKVNHDDIYKKGVFGGIR